jgi:hypothetical protein
MSKTLRNDSYGWKQYFLDSGILGFFSGMGLWTNSFSITECGVDGYCPIIFLFPSTLSVGAFSNIPGLRLAIQAYNL